MIKKLAIIVSVFCVAVFVISGCTATMARVTPATNISKEFTIPVNLDISKISYERSKEPIPVIVQIADPTQRYRLPWQNIGSHYVKGTLVHNLKIGEGLAAASPLIWGRYLDVRPKGEKGVPVIQMSFGQLLGEGTTDFSSINAYSGSDSVRHKGHFELTLICKLLSPDGKEIAEFSSLQKASIDNSNNASDMGKVTSPEQLILKGFNNILSQFFGDTRVADALRKGKTGAQIAKVTERMKPEPAGEKTGKISNSPANRWAVIVGLSEYQNAGKGGLGNLIYADDDAKAFSDSLSSLGWSKSHIKLLVNKDATIRNITIALESWLTKAGTEDMIVLYWAGHGFPDPENPNKVYFVCYDTDMQIPATGYRMDRVRDVLEERGARNVLVIADTCHAGKLITRGDERGMAVRPFVENLDRKKKVPRGWIFMVAAESDRQSVEHTSWKNGAFTHCLLEAMKGDADGYRGSGAKDGVVTLGEIKEYLNTAMPDKTQRVLGVAKRPLITTSTGDADIWHLTLKKK